MKSLLALLAVVALPVMAAEPTLYGRYEYIQLPEIGETFKAKMDTGALTASLSARDIETFTRDGEDWVRFRLSGKDVSNKVYEHKVARISKIKNRADEDEDGEETSVAKRPVVDLEMPGQRQAHRRSQPHRPQQFQLPAVDRRQGPA